MARSKSREKNLTPGVISIIGPGMSVMGDCITEGSVRIEGSVQGQVWAGKGVVVGRAGTVKGDVRTQDAVIAGEVRGSVLAASRLEVHDGARIDGEIQARRFQLQEGANVNGEIRMGEIELGAPPRLVRGPVAKGVSPNGAGANHIVPADRSADVEFGTEALREAVEA